MFRNITFVLFFIINLFTSLAIFAKNPNRIYSDCVKEDVQCEKDKIIGMESDRRSYEKWCKKHPKKCPKERKMF